MHFHGPLHNHIYEKNTHLNKANISGLLAEALAADVQAILANDTVIITTNAATEQGTISSVSEQSEKGHPIKKDQPRLHMPSLFYVKPRVAHHLRDPSP